MAVTGSFRHIGTFSLLVATVLLIVTTISAPVVNDIGLLKINLANATSEHWSEVSFGTFGWCVTNTADGDRDFCSTARVGYNIADVLTAIEQTTFSNGTRESVTILTRVMILHPIATGLSFLAFLLALGLGGGDVGILVAVGSHLAALASILAFLVMVVALICDFVLFGILRDHVNSREHDTSGSHAKFSAAIWTLLAAGFFSLVGAIAVSLTCCSARLRKRRASREPGTKSDYGVPTPRRRRWF